MTEFTVGVVRIGYAIREIKIEAETLEAAEQAALARAGDESFDEHTSEYKLEREVGDDVTDVVAMLNNAFLADPNAMHALVCNRVPCNELLADDPFVGVDTAPVLVGKYFQVGALGLINGVMRLYRHPLIGAMFSDEEDEDGHCKMTGFCEARCSADAGETATVELPSNEKEAQDGPT